MTFSFSPSLMMFRMTWISTIQLSATTASACPSNLDAFIRWNCRRVPPVSSLGELLHQHHDSQDFPDLSDSTQDFLIWVPGDFPQRVELSSADLAELQVLVSFC